MLPVIVNWTTGPPEQDPDQEEKDHPEAADAASVIEVPAT
jgi:hypothetical protein